ncbi:MAG: sulfatase [Armatimonadota bacterium]|nr:sulfatase [Armatimonadota bacterium]
MGRDSLTRREFLTLIGAGSAAIATSGGLAGIAEGAKPSRKPNIVVILADDLGYGELGMQGNKEIPTPNIDSIAANGVRFTNGYVTCPVCSPTRAGLATGRYQQRFGHEVNPGLPGTEAENFGLPLSETIFASRLKSAGYATGAVGKWHLGFRPELMPLKRGFDEFFGFLDGGMYYMGERPEGARGIMRNNDPVEESEYLTDAFGREAKAFIEKHKDEPFFLYLAFNAVHSPLQITQKYLDRFPHIQDEKRRKYAGMTSAMDDAIGRTLSAIRDNGLENDTLIIFLSDNGGPTGETTSSNGPLKGGKGIVYEGGVRIPYCMQWKGKLPAGALYDKPVISLDIAPTALAAAGVKAPDAKFDGVNLLPYLKKGANKGNPHDALYWRIGSMRAIRKGDWKLAKLKPTMTELYNLKDDIGETTDLAARNPEKVKELTDQLMKWDSELAKPLW